MIHYTKSKIGASMVALALYPLPTIAETGYFALSGSATIETSSSTSLIGLSGSISKELETGTLQGSASHFYYSNKNFNYYDMKAEYSQALPVSKTDNTILKVTIGINDHYEANISHGDIALALTTQNNLSESLSSTLSAEVLKDWASIDANSYTSANASIGLNLQTKATSSSIFASMGHLEFKNGLTEDLATLSVNTSYAIFPKLYLGFNASDTRTFDTFKSGTRVIRTIQDSQVVGLSLSYRPTSAAALTVYINDNITDGSNFRDENFTSGVRLNYIF